MTAIDLKEFEHFFESTALKKGLQFFKNDKVFFINKNSDELYNFSIEGKKIIDISLVKKGKKILNYSCSCSNKKNNCEHLAAVFFYLEKPHLNIDNKNLNNDFKEKNIGFKNPLKKYRKIIKNLLNNYSHFEKLSLLNNLRKIESELKYSTKNKLIFFHLSVICELPKLFSIKISNRNYLLNLINNSVEFIDLYCSSPLKLDELEALYQTVLQIFKNKRYLKIDYFDGVLKKSISLIDDKQKIEHLKNYIFKLKNNSKDNFFSLDKYEILKHYVQIKEHSFHNFSIKKSIDINSIEYAIANFEFAVNSGKKAIAFKELNTFYKILKQKNNPNIVTFLDYILLVSKKYNNTKLEISCICDLLIFDFEINDELINRLKELVEKDKIDSVINNLISDIKSKQNTSTNLKVITLLNHFGRFDGIVTELKNSGNQFQLLNFIALKNLPSYSLKFLDLYIIHLRSALQNTGYEFQQESIFKTSKKYIDKLPVNAKTYIIEKILSSFNKSKFIYKLIKASYP